MFNFCFLTSGRHFESNEMLDVIIPYHYVDQTNREIRVSFYISAYLVNHFRSSTQHKIINHETDKPELAVSYCSQSKFQCIVNIKRIRTYSVIVFTFSQLNYTLCNNLIFVIFPAPNLIHALRENFIILFCGLLLYNFISKFRLG